MRFFDRYIWWVEVGLLLLGGGRDWWWVLRQAYIPRGQKSIHWDISLKYLGVWRGLFCLFLLFFWLLYLSLGYYIDLVVCSVYIHP